jgi:SAM-dependent methyltransferase
MKNTKLHDQKLLVTIEKRLISYGMQINQVIELSEKIQEKVSVLEVGIGNGYFTLMLKWLGHTVKTCDINPEYNPDYFGDIREVEIDEKFDVVASFEALQHIPYNDFEEVLIRLKNLSKKYIFLSLPYYCPHKITLHIKLPIFFRRLGLPLEIKWLKIFKLSTHKNREYSGEHNHHAHYWEINRDGFPKERVFSAIKNSGLKIINSYHNFQHPYHFFILCEKNSQ